MGRVKTDVRMGYTRGKIQPGRDGFTILELSIVLAIIALVTTMAVGSGIGVIAAARQSATVQKMAAIEKALMAFRIANDRIPCPGDLTLPPGNANYGAEAGAATPSLNSTTTPSSGVGNGACSGALWYMQSGVAQETTITPAANFSLNNQMDSAVTTAIAAEGSVPTAALGVPSDFMYDGWGNHIHYVVDVYMTQTGSFSAMPAGALCGPITICDSYGVSRGACVNTARSSAAMYALISHGANGYGAYTQNGVMSSSSSSNANEQINCHYHGSACYSAISRPNPYWPIYVQQSPGYQSGYAGNSLYYFDDIVTFKERWQMQTAWDTQGTACPSVWWAFNGGLQQYNMLGDTGLSIFNPGYYNWQPVSPTGVAVDANGNVWWADAGLNAVVEVSVNQGSNYLGEWLMDIGGNCSGYMASSGTDTPLPVGSGGCDLNSCNCNPGTGNGMFGNNSPQALALDASGNIWVADTGNNRVQEFGSNSQWPQISSNGLWLMTIGGGAACTGCTSASSCTCTSGSGDGALNSPNGIAIDPHGNIWVVDSGNNRVQNFNSNGQWLLTIGGDGDSGTHLCTQCVSNSSCTCTSGATNGQFNSPTGISSDASGNIWVADTGNNRVQEFSSTGTYLGSVSVSGATAIAIDASGNLQVGSSNGMTTFSKIGGTWTTTGTDNINGAVSGVAISR